MENLQTVINIIRCKDTENHWLLGQVKFDDNYCIDYFLDILQNIVQLQNAGQSSPLPHKSITIGWLWGELSEHTTKLKFGEIARAV